MKKIFTLFALLVGMTSAVFADGNEGGFQWVGNARYLFHTLQITGDMTSITITPSAANGNEFFIEIMNDCTIESTNGNAITVDASQYTGNVKLNISAPSSSYHKMTVKAAHHPFYFRLPTSGTNRVTLQIENDVELTCIGQQYAIASSANSQWDMELGYGVSLTMDCNGGHFNNLRLLTPKSKIRVIDPEGATFLNSVENNAVKLNGEVYTGKATITTGFGVKINGTEIDYSNKDNFTSGVTAGSVKYNAGILTFDHATITGNIMVPAYTASSIIYYGENTINGDLEIFRGGQAFNLWGATETGVLTINGTVALETVNILYISYAGTCRFINPTGSTLVRKPYMFGLGEEQRTKVFVNKMLDNLYPALYIEAQDYGLNTEFSATDNGIFYEQTDGYTVSEGTTGAGLKYVSIRHLEEYGIEVGDKDGVIYAVTSENKDDVLGDGGSVVYSPEEYKLTLDFADLTSLTIDQAINLELVGWSVIDFKGYNGGALVARHWVTFTGTGHLNVFSKTNNLPAVVLEDDGNLVVRAGLDIISNSYAIRGDGNSTVSIEHAIVSLQSKEPGLLSGIKSFGLTGCEYHEPVGTEFVNGLLCVDNQPIAPETVVTIWKIQDEGIESIESSAKLGGSHKILRDGQLYILRNGQIYTTCGQTVQY